MSFKSILQDVKDELDSNQCFVDFKVSHNGIQIISTNELDRLLAKKELERRKFIVAP
jgi:hypothetical protein